MERNCNIDLIKICACLGVCTLHFYFREMESLGHFRPDFVLFYMATIAMPLFFMVNGYLLMSKARKASYYLKRILNILKIVFSVNALYYIVIHFMRGQILLNPIEKPFVETFNNLFLQEGTFSIFWFFGALLIIYIIMAMIPSSYLTTKALVVVIMTCMIVSFIVNVTNLFPAIYTHTHTHTHTARIVFEAFIPQTFRLYNHISYFLLGGLISRNKTKIEEYMVLRSKLYIILSWLMIVVCTVASIWKCNTIYGITRVEHLHCSLITTLGTIGSFYLFMHLRMQSTTLKIIQLLAPCVLMVYIVHRIILYHTNIAIGGLWYNLILFWILSFSIAYLLDKVKFIHKYFKL